MRRLSLILLVSILALPAAALAAREDKSDGVFELKAGNGAFILNGRGVLLGQLDKGSLRVQDMNPNDGAQPAISGAEHMRPTDDPNVTLYWGTNVHFRVSGGKYRIRIKGAGIDLTAIGVGTVDMTGNGLSLDPGEFALNGGRWTAVPYLDRIVPFGAQPAGPPTGP